MSQSYTPSKNALAKPGVHSDNGQTKTIEQKITKFYCTGKVWKYEMKINMKLCTGWLETIYQEIIFI